MKVLVDTSVWSLALRRNEPEGAMVRELEELIHSSMVVMIGPVRQELLSGIGSEKTFELLRTRLAAFPDMPIAAEDYETAARFFNSCRKHGVQGSQIDFLICAVANNHDLVIFTTDDDFSMYAKYIPVRLYVARS